MIPAFLNEQQVPAWAYTLRRYRRNFFYATPVGFVSRMRWVDALKKLGHKRLNLLILLGSCFVKDKNAFLFTLANPTGARPTKLPQSDGNSGIWCNPSLGPGFGSANVTSIWFMNSNQSCNCSVNNGYNSVQIPQGQAISTFVYGNTSFGMNYLEIFGLKQT